MKKVNTHLYEVSKKEIKELSEETQVLVFNAFDVKYYIEKPSRRYYTLPLPVTFFFSIKKNKPRR